MSEEKLMERLRGTEEFPHKIGLFPGCPLKMSGLRRKQVARREVCRKPFVRDDTDKARRTSGKFKKVQRSAANNGQTESR